MFDVGAVLVFCLAAVVLWYGALAVAGIFGAVNAWWRG